MKIGILTLHDGINYGAFFQVYCMQCYLESLGHEVYVIHYKSPGFTYREYRVFLTPLHPIYSLKNLRRISKFRTVQKKLNLTRRMFFESQLRNIRFDCVVIGSDEMWNYQSQLIGNNPVYFSRGINAERITSYAASFGSVPADQQLPENIVELLTKMDAVSVRDDNSMQIVKNNLSKKPPVVVDPTFLCDIPHNGTPKTDGGYILVYGLFDDEMKQKTLDFTSQTGLKTISVGYNNKWCNRVIQLSDPFEWLGFVEHASYVITSFYHGLCFSILKRKQFCFFNTPARQNKIGSFLEKIGLEDRRVGPNQSITEMFQEPIDYEPVYEKLDRLVQYSKSFIEEATS